MFYFSKSWIKKEAVDFITNVYQERIENHWTFAIILNGYKRNFYFQLKENADAAHLKFLERMGIEPIKENIKGSGLYE